MKYLIYPVLLITLIACSSKKPTNDEDEHNPKTLPSDSTEQTGQVTEFSDDSFGDNISREGAVPAHTVPALMQKQDSLEIKIRGEVTEVCQKKGCWMVMDLEENETMRVTFKDYGFFVPKDIGGKVAIIKGTVKREVTDVAALQHYAKDAGKDIKEIEAINEPEESLVFVAEGVIIEK